MHVTCLVYGYVRLYKMYNTDVFFLSLLLSHVNWNYFDNVCGVKGRRPSGERSDELTLQDYVVVVSRHMSFIRSGYCLDPTNINVDAIKTGQTQEILILNYSINTKLND